LLQGTNIVWGRNLGGTDDDFVAVVSAVLTRARLNPFDSTQLRTVLQNSALASLFALSTTGESPSIQSEVNPQINLIFVVFMLVPMIATLVIFLGTRRRPKLPVPTDGWQLMVLGREEDVVPTRHGSESEFPDAVSKNYEFAIRNDSSRRTMDERLGIFQSESKEPNARPEVKNLSHDDSKRGPLSSAEAVAHGNNHHTAVAGSCESNTVRDDPFRFHRGAVDPPDL